MKNTLLKALSLLLTVSMLVIPASFVSSAAETQYLTYLAASDGSVELDGTNPATVTVSIVSTEALTCYGIEGTWDTVDVSEKITLTGISSDVLAFEGNNYVDVKTGKVMWVDDTFTAGPTSNGAKLLTATYKVAADTPAGTYTVRFLTEVFTGADGNPDETATYFTATITVTHKKTNINVISKGVDGYTVDGNVVTVTHSVACKVGYWDATNSKYVAITAVANADGSYSFTAPEGVEEVLLVVKGDVTLDGKVLAGDVSRLNAAVIGRTAMTDEAAFAAEVTGDGKILAGDGARITASILGKKALAW